LFGTLIPTDCGEAIGYYVTIELANVFLISQISSAMAPPGVAIVEITPGVFNETAPMANLLVIFFVMNSNVILGLEVQIYFLFFGKEKKPPKWILRYFENKNKNQILPGNVTKDRFKIIGITVG